ncbi:MAG: sugar transferase [Clostridiales bacterium]|nr:sugar transferase [Clostridiales bacterium]
MKKVILTFRRTIIFLIKITLYISLLGSFFLIMGIENWQLLRLSRTAGITLSTFCVVGLGLTAAYGTFDIGLRKSKPIIASLGLATVLTDLITYVQLAIMNTNDANNRQFKFENIGLLLIVIVVQIWLIVIFTYAGNYIYFRMHAPERCCVVTESAESLSEIVNAILSFKKQYKICFARDYRSDQLYDTILKCDTVFIYNVPVQPRTEIMEFCYRNLRNVYISPEIADVVEINAKHVILDDISLISAPVKELSFEQKIMKRLMDIILSLIALIISSPVLLLCAVSIKLCDGGKIIFKQKRATKNGKVFQVYKFRTMKENVENFSAISDDKRITSVGRIMRKYRLDELPQFINILKGEMSMVGPRPEMLENVYLYTKEYPEFAYRLRVKAGLTGYAQIAGKYNTSPKYKLVLDLMYIEKYSLIKDIKLLLQTLIVLFKPDSTEAFNKEKRVVLAQLDKASNDWWEE